MADTTYNLQPSDVGAALQSIISQGTKNSIIQALQANGLLGNNDTQLNVQVIPVTEYTTVIDGNNDQVTVLGPNVNTQVTSIRRPWSRSHPVRITSASPTRRNRRFRRRPTAGRR